MGKVWDAADRAALEDLKRKSVQVSDASPELVKGVQERSKAIIEKWIQNAKTKGVDGEKAYAEFHEELKRVAAGQ